MRNPIMTSERVYLRPYEPSDAEALAEMTASESETFMYRGRTPLSPLTYAHWLAEAYRQQPPRNIEFAVCLQTDDRLIGNVGVGDLDWVNRTGETGSEFAPAYRGQGYGTEAKHLLLEYCFDRLYLHGLLSAVFETNTRSTAALLKQGYRPAGRLRWHDVKDGVYRDLLLFDLLRADWLAACAAWLLNRSPAR